MAFSNFWIYLNCPTFHRSEEWALGNEQCGEMPRQQMLRLNQRQRQKGVSISIYASFSIKLRYILLMSILVVENEIKLVSIVSVLCAYVLVCLKAQKRHAAYSSSKGIPTSSSYGCI